MAKPLIQSNILNLNFYYLNIGRCLKFIITITTAYRILYKKSDYLIVIYN